MLRDQMVTTFTKFTDCTGVYRRWLRFDSVSLVIDNIWQFLLHSVRKTNYVALRTVCELVQLLKSVMIDSRVPCPFGRQQANSCWFAFISTCFIIINHALNVAYGFIHHMQCFDHNVTCKISFRFPMNIGFDSSLKHVPYFGAWNVLHGTPTSVWYRGVDWIRFCTACVAP